MRVQGAAPLGGTRGDGMGTSRLRNRMRAGMNSTKSRAITPRKIRMKGMTVARGLVTGVDGSLMLFTGVGEPPGPWFVPVPCVFVLVPVGVMPLVGDAPTVGDVLAPTVEDVGEGITLRVALGAGLVVAVGDGVCVTVGEGVVVTVGVVVVVTVGEGVVVTVGDGVVVTVGEGVVVMVGDGVLVSAGVTPGEV